MEMRGGVGKEEGPSLWGSVLGPQDEAMRVSRGPRASRGPGARVSSAFGEIS
jgi:hypothetical protein